MLELRAVDAVLHDACVCNGQLIAFLEGERTLEEAVERIKFETHRFARQQATWFRLDDERIRWFDLRTGITTSS